MMRFEHIEATTAKELTAKLNNFSQHVQKKYKEKPQVDIFQPNLPGQKWNAFVVFGIDEE